MKRFATHTAIPHAPVARRSTRSCSPSSSFGGARVLGRMDSYLEVHGYF